MGAQGTGGTGEKVKLSRMRPQPPRCLLNEVCRKISMVAQLVRLPFLFIISL